MSELSNGKLFALAGNPNSGKTTLFNSLTGSDQKVGNWPGVTVERAEGHIHTKEVEGRIIDLPGIYTLVPHSEDEYVARNTLISESYDLVINVVDASNLRRNLYLTTQLLEMDIPLLVVLNKIDLAEKAGVAIDADLLSQELGVPVIAVSAQNAEEVRNVIKAIEASVSRESASAGKKVSFAKEIEELLKDFTICEKDLSLMSHTKKRGLLLGLLEQDHVIINIVQQVNPEILEFFKTELENRNIVLEDSDTSLAESRYRAIDSLVEAAAVSTGIKRKKRFNPDDILLHPVLGIFAFFGVMYLVFFVTMTLGGAFIDFFDLLSGAVFVDGFGFLLELIQTPAWLKSFLADGLGGGIQTITTFIPVVFFMFIMLGLLEDSGYMARGAYVMDRFMRLVGLPGKAFVPLLVGFGCSVPAIMATRTLESKRDRFLTIFMIPTMSCSARLPVYAIFAAAFFNRYAGLVVFSLYMVGVLFSVLTGVIMKRTLFKGSFSPFIMELPEYSLPRMGKIAKDALFRLRIFIFRAGKVIIVAVAILTFLGSWGTDGTFGNDSSENSVLAGIGKRITPVFSPMGVGKDDWQVTVGLFTGLFAKEAIIGTLNSLYSQDSDAVTQASEFSDAQGQQWPWYREFGAILSGGVLDALASVRDNGMALVEGFTDPLGLKDVTSSQEELSESIGIEKGVLDTLMSAFTGASAYAFLLFVLIYFPCVAAFGAAVRETGRLYGSLLVIYLTIMAWVTAVLFYQIAEGGSVHWIGIAVMISLLVYATLLFMGRERRKNRIDAELFI